MDSIFDLPITPKDAKLTINFMHLFPTSQWHLTKDGTDYTEARHPLTLKLDIERIGDMDWMYYVDLGLEYVGFLGQECRFGFQLTGCTESGLYIPGLIHTLLASCTKEFFVFLRQYATKNNIINLPEESIFSVQDIAMLAPQLVEGAEKRGFVTFGDPRMLELNFTLKKDMDLYLSVLETTAAIVDILLYNKLFENQSNKAEINKFIDIGRVMTIMHKCTFKYKNETIKLSNEDTFNLLILVDMCLQCVVGQIWYRIKPFMQPFDQEKEIFFLQAGHFFIKTVMEEIGNPQVSNLINPADWDNLLA